MVKVVAYVAIGCWLLLMCGFVVTGLYMIWSDFRHPPIENERDE